MTLQFFTATAAIATPAPSSTPRHKAAAPKPQQRQQHQWLQQVLPALLQALLSCSKLLAGTGTAAAGSSILCSLKDQAAADKVSLQGPACRKAGGSAGAIVQVVAARTACGVAANAVFDSRDAVCPAHMLLM
jgi:hypothetical protein